MSGKTVILKNNRKGFAYISALMLVFIAGIALTGAGRCWSLVIQREKEAELLFRGGQIKRAIESYYNSTPENAYPRNLKDLLKDQRFSVIKRHLRKLYKDPMTKDGQWKLFLDPKGAVKGVCSRSTKKPLKTGGFKKEYQKFEDADEYSDWHF
jgi:type II secretory pathway pseudopilin PulG